jgi:hypothetical protein
VNATVPLPLPLAPDVMEIHDGALGTAVHVQPGDVVTLNEPVPPAIGTVAPDALSAYVQLGRTAAWLTVNVWPAMTMLSDRAVPRLGSTRKPTVPFPLPLAPEVNVIHDAPVVAIHAQPDAALTETDPAPPTAVNDALLASSV